MSAALIRLSMMLSPAFPVGGFAYSAGLERAAADGLVRDADGLRDWLAASLVHGPAWNDAVLFAEAHRRASFGAPLGDLHELALALAGSAGRHAETAGQGASFAEAASILDAKTADGVHAYAVAVGETAGRTAISLDIALPLFLAAWASNLVQIAIRLSVVGQTGGISALAALEPLIAETASRAASSNIDDLGACATTMDIAAMNHETMTTRLFRS